MVCKNVEEYTSEYTKIVDEIKNICTKRVCTLGAIQKTLGEKGITISEGAIVSVMTNIIEIITFDKVDTYDTGDVVTYQKGKIFKSEVMANLLIKISYKRFYLYDAERHKDAAFKEHIHSRLEFEIKEKNEIGCTSELTCALQALDIPEEKWQNYVFVSEINNKVFCMKKTDTRYASKIYLGKFIKRT